MQNGCLKNGCLKKFNIFSFWHLCICILKVLRRPEKEACLILPNWMAFCSLQFSSVQSLSRVQLFATPWIAACQASLSITSSRSSLKLMSIESVILSSHLILCRPLLLLPLIPLSIECFPMSQLFTWGGQSTGVSASASVLPMNNNNVYMSLYICPNP